MITTNNEYIGCFNQAISSVTAELKKILLNLDDEIKAKSQEIRLRVNSPAVLRCDDGFFYLTALSEVSISPEDGYFCSKELLHDTFSRMCEYSIHTYQSDIVNGFVTLKGGHRAGICGTAAVDSRGNLLSVRDISSINIRISKEIYGCSDAIIKSVLPEKNKSIIIAGPPASGKTTVLRDIVRHLSDSGKNVSLIDERFEVACVNHGISQKTVGVNTDIYSGYPKEKALNIAVRTMAPDFIAIDEVCDFNEIDAIRTASNCGAKFIATVHAADFKEIVSRLQIISLIRTNAFDNLVLLSGKSSERNFIIYDIGEINDEIYRRRSYMDDVFIYGDKNFSAI